MKWGWQTVNGKRLILLTLLIISVTDLVPCAAHTSAVLPVTYELNLEVSFLLPRLVTLLISQLNDFALRLRSG